MIHEDELARLYTDEGWTLRELSDADGRCVSVIRRRLIARGVRMRVGARRVPHDRKAEIIKRIESSELQTEIAGDLGLTPQRVNQIWQEYKAQKK